MGCNQTNNKETYKKYNDTLHKTREELICSQQTITNIQQKIKDLKNKTTKFAAKLLKQEDTKLTNATTNFQEQNQQHYEKVIQYINLLLSHKKLENNNEDLAPIYEASNKEQDCIKAIKQYIQDNISQYVSLTSSIEHIYNTIDINSINKTELDNIIRFIKYMNSVFNNIFRITGLKGHKKLDQNINNNCGGEVVGHIEGEQQEESLTNNNDDEFEAVPFEIEGLETILLEKILTDNQISELTDHHDKVRKLYK